MELNLTIWNSQTKFCFCQDAGAQFGVKNFAVQRHTQLGSKGSGMNQHADPPKIILNRSGDDNKTGTLGKAMAVLELVSSSDTPLRFTDLLNQSKQPRGTLHRQLTNLVEEGLLNLRHDGGYELGYTLLKFASRAWAGNEFRKVAEPHLNTLHQQTGETVHLGVLRNGQVIYLDKVEGSQAVRMYSTIGNASPVYCTGVGKAALSVLEPQLFEAQISTINFHTYTEHTLNNASKLRAQMEKIRERGIAFDLEEHELGIRCVAAPVYSQDKAIIAGVSVTGPAYRVTVEQLNGWSELVSIAAERIMNDMAAMLGPRL